MPYNSKNIKSVDRLNLVVAVPLNHRIPLDHNQSISDGSLKSQSVSMSRGPYHPYSHPRTTDIDECNKRGLYNGIGKTPISKIPTLPIFTFTLSATRRKLRDYNIRLLPRTNRQTAPLTRPAHLSAPETELSSLRYHSSSPAHLSSILSRATTMECFSGNIHMYLTLSTPGPRPRGRVAEEDEEEAAGVHPSGTRG